MLCVLIRIASSRDYNKYTQHTIININKKNTLNFPNILMSAVIDFFLGTQERVRNSRGKRAIGVRAIESSTVNIDSLMSGMIHVQIQKSHKRNFF